MKDLEAFSSSSHVNVPSCCCLLLHVLFNNKKDVRMRGGIHYFPKLFCAIFMYLRTRRGVNKNEIEESQDRQSTNDKHIQNLSKHIQYTVPTSTSTSTNTTSINASIYQYTDEHEKRRIVWSRGEASFCMSSGTANWIIATGNFIPTVGPWNINSI